MSKEQLTKQAATTAAVAAWVLAVLVAGALAEPGPNTPSRVGQANPVVLLGLEVASERPEGTEQTGTADHAWTTTISPTLTPPGPDARPKPAPRFSALGTVCRPNYWIVSGRHCPQGFPPCASYCHFDYLHVGPDGRIQRATQQDFLQSLVPGVPVCIVAHGSFVPFEYVAWQTYYTYQWLRLGAPELPLHVVFYTWPSEAPVTGIPQIDVDLLGRRGEFNGFYLARLISLISPDHPLSLLGHSHGTRVIASALHLLAGGSVQGYCLTQPNQQRRIRVVFAASAMDHDWLNPGRRYGRALCAVEGLLNLRNRMDIALFFYPLAVPFSRRALARSGFTRSDLYQLGWLATKISECDVTAWIGFGHQWVNYLRYPALAQLVAPYVYFSDLYEQRSSAESGGPGRADASGADGTGKSSTPKTHGSTPRRSDGTRRRRAGRRAPSAVTLPASRVPTTSGHTARPVLDASSTCRCCSTARL